MEAEERATLAAALSELASTDAVPDHVDAIQFDSNEGPALDVLVTDDYVRVDDLADDNRWPRFGRRAVEVGNIRSMISYRLYLGRHRRAALSFYSTWPHAFDDVAAAIGAIFAAYCSLALITQALGDDVHPHRASEVHREIGVAVGILMAAGELGADEAFTQLHSASRRLHRELQDVARHVTATGRLPDDPAGPAPPKPARRADHLSAPSSAASGRARPRRSIIGWARCSSLRSDW